MMIFIYIVLITVVTWTIVTYYVEQQGPVVYESNPNSSREHSAIVVFDPDPINSEDYRISEMFFQALTKAGWSTVLASVLKTHELDLSKFNLYVICPNVYTFGADRAVKNFVSGGDFLKDKHVAVLAVGSSGIDRARKEVEDLVANKGGHILETEDLQSLMNEYQRGEGGKTKSIDSVTAWIRKLDRLFL